MDDDSNNAFVVDTQTSRESKGEWVEKHARQLQQLYEQWQQPIGIDGQEYQKHLEKELAGYWDDPLLKTLIESI